MSSLEHPGKTGIPSRWDSSKRGREGVSKLETSKDRSERRRALRMQKWEEGRRRLLELKEEKKELRQEEYVERYGIILDRLFDGPSTIEELKEKTGLTIGQLRLSLVRFYQKGWVRYWGV